MTRSILIAVASAFALAACSNLTGNHAEGPSGTDAGINTAWMDKSVTPGDDFYGYADGGWMRATEIPADRSNIGGFWMADQERERNTARDAVTLARFAAGAKMKEQYPRVYCRSFTRRRRSFSRSSWSI